MDRRPPLRGSALLLVPLVALTAACGTEASAGGEGTPSDRADGPAAGGSAGAAAVADSVACAPDDGGLELPEGFCAQVVAKDVGRARHLAVDPGGDLYVALRSGRGADAPSGGIVALRDTTGDGIADVRRRVVSDLGGTGVALRDGHLYYGRDDAVLRWELPDGALAPGGEPDTIVSGLRHRGGHAAKPLAFDGEGHLYLNVGSPSNACQQEQRTPGSPGRDPCPQLEENAGIWQFDADRTGQTQADGERYATGMRNTVALTFNPLDGHLYAVIHGRDQLAGLWPDLYTREESAELPGEEFARVERGDDYGWPYCYYDQRQGKKVLAPEYGGDGQEVGRCAEKDDPLLAFPGHWGPNGVHFYTADHFPERYRGGAFVAFHGSWNRAPLPQEGYNVVFVPFAGGEPTGEWSVFAEGFREEGEGPREADHRPSGVAQGPDGSLYVTDDQSGWIWRIRWVGS